MGGLASIIVAGIGAVVAVTTSFFTAQAAADTRFSGLDNRVTKVETTQDLQYKEIQKGIERIEKRLDAMPSK